MDGLFHDVKIFKYLNKLLIHVFIYLLFIIHLFITCYLDVCYIQHHVYA